MCKQVSKRHSSKTFLNYVEDLVQEIEKRPSLNTSKRLLAINLLLEQSRENIQLNSSDLVENGATSLKELETLRDLRARTSQLGITAK